MIHLPILRAGKPYRSIDVYEMADVRTGEPVARVSQANRGLIGRDLLQAADNQRKLAALSMKELLEICRKASELFTEAELPVDPVDGVMQTPDEFVRCQSATTGMPQSLSRANMEKTRFVLAEMETVLAGLTRGLDLEVLDRGWAIQDGRTVSYAREALTLGGVLPSNSPGVHSLWLPSIPLKVPLVLKPGRAEPWTPMRVIQALIAAGCPPEAFSFYPTDHGGAGEILMRTDRSMVFGDASTVAPWRNDHRVQIHGPGWSKVVVGQDRAGDWKRYVDMMATSVALNGGRSCLNASGIWVTAHGRKVAEALATKLAEVRARGLDDPEAQLACFPQANVAHAVSDYIDAQLAVEGAEDMSAVVREGGRVKEIDGCTFLEPTVVWCKDPEHPLTKSEFLFPFVTVVEVPQEEMLERMGSTLVVTALTDDRQFLAEMMAAPNVDRLNIGEIPTIHVSWDQPHEGNLFEHLYRQRAFQMAAGEGGA